MLQLTIDTPIHAENAGLAVTSGRGTHPTRTINNHEIIFVRSGHLLMFEGESTYRVVSGEALHLSPGVVHGGAQPYKRELSFFWIHFTVDQHRGRQLSDDRVVVPKHRAVSRPDHLTELFRRFLDDQESGWLGKAQADLLITLMLLEVADERPGDIASLDGSEALAAKANAFIRSNVTQDITSSSIASHLRCNADYLGRVFRKLYGRSLTTAIHELRVRKARSLLLDSAMNVDEVARRCGFEDPGYFRRIFRRYEQMSPRAYRNLYGRVHVNIDG